MQDATLVDVDHSAPWEVMFFGPGLAIVVNEVNFQASR